VEDWIRTEAAQKRASREDAGFTLLEVIVAFVIAALALGVLYQGAVGGLRAAQNASRYEQALSRARSRLVIAQYGSPLTPEDLQGDDGGGFRWRLRAVPAAATTVKKSDPAGLRPAAQFPITLYAVNVWISWRDFGQDRSVRLETELIGETPR